MIVTENTLTTFAKSKHPKQTWEIKLIRSNVISIIILYWKLHNILKNLTAKLIFKINCDRFAVLFTLEVSLEYS